MSVLPDVFEQLQLPPPIGILAPTTDHSTVPPRRRSRVAVAVEHLATMPAEIPLAVNPAHRRDIEPRQQCTPWFGFRLLFEVVGQREAGRAVQIDLDRADVLQRMAGPGQRVAEPPLDVGRSCRPERP